MLRKLIAILLTLFLLPIIIFGILLIYFEDGSPGIFKQKRLGIFGKVFYIYKIRTMKNETPSLGTHEVHPSYNLHYGSRLRRFKIDEFPQIFNIVKGDINFIGSRPGLPNQIELKEFRNKEGVLSSKPGITGLAQVCGFDMSDPMKLSKIDSLYLEKRSFFLDLKIIVATFSNLFRNDLKGFIRNNLDV